ncbi:MULTISPECIES: flagellar assembly protein FliH [Arthrobacter]|uniref:flagellar assembly protein FliH n=1 Tax=Arthrobacter TaxID=1663 RepID=UPI0006D9E77A|nr:MULTISPECIES: flagellar assembly protein FliH [unclassified Arthrobacter]KPN18852.1 hypothetical protein AO716_13925 [Arthrobacter sp. Edens01]
MSSLPRSAGPALEPIREAIRADAAAQSGRILDTAERQAAEIRQRGRSEAEQIRSRAEADGREAARAEAQLRSARARRAAGGTVLAAEEELRGELRREVLAQAAALRSGPRYPALLDALRDQARELLGPDAHVVEAPAGGVTATLGSRSVDLSLPALADAALERHAGEVRSLWQE